VLFRSWATAGRNAAEYAGKAKRTGSDGKRAKSLEEKALKLLDRKGGIRPAEVRRRIQTEAHRCLGPIRKKEELEAFLLFLRGVKKNELGRLSTISGTRTYNKEWIDALELENIVSLLEVSVASALARTEIRGVHFREDFPRTDNDRWLLESIASWTGEGPAIAHRPVTSTSLTPPGGITPYLEMVKTLMAAHSDVGGHH
jgi:succinate dehydrogenase/fumarate reductase flavoprotein subunit